MKNINYSIDNLRALIELYRAQSFVQAARALHITQPALTRRIQLLEESVDGKLVDRTTRSLAFTSLGQRLIAQITDPLNTLDQHVLDAGRIARGESGTLVFACLTTVAYAIAPGVIAGFHRQFPRMRVSMLDDTGQRVIESVVGGRAEFGVGLIYNDLPGMDVQKVCEDPFVLAMPRDHALAHRRKIPWSELNSMKVVALRQTSGNRQQIDATLDRHGIVPPWFDEVEHLSSLLGWLHTGHGIGVIPKLAMRTAEAKSLRCVPLVEPDIRRTIALVKRKGSTLSKPSQHLWDVFNRALRS